MSVTVTLILADATERAIAAPVGLSLMEALRREGLIEGECNGSLACATCHVWVDEAFAAHLPPPSPGEEDMLDCAFHLAPTSRLSCQIVLDAALDGLRVAIPGPGAPVAPAAAGRAV